MRIFTSLLKVKVDKLKERKDVEGLIKALNKRNFVLMRREAALALGEIGDARAVDPLIVLFRDAKRPLREAAVEALTKI